jgi:hypothetical protein
LVNSFAVWLCCPASSSNICSFILLEHYTLHHLFPRLGAEISLELQYAKVVYSIVVEYLSCRLPIVIVYNMRTFEWVTETSITVPIGCNNIFELRTKTYYKAWTEDDLSLAVIYNETIALGCNQRIYEPITEACYKPWTTLVKVLYNSTSL